MSFDDWRETSLGAEVDLLTGFPFISAQYTDDICSGPQKLDGF